MVGFDEVRQSISLLSGYKQIDEQTELGAGCWGGVTEDGSQHKSVVMVGNREAAEWNGALKLERIIHPRCKGHLLDFDSAGKPWYDFATLAGYLEGADQQFAVSTMNEAITLFEPFWWGHSSSVVTIVGLILATWVQSIWDFRPQVAIVGATNSGKTVLFNTLVSIFGGLSLKSSLSTASGIRQAIKTSSQIVLCDEFEDSKFRVEILEMLRTSSRGDKILRGTTNQRGVEFGLQHIAWVAAIEVGLKNGPRTAIGSSCWNCR